VRRTLPLWWVPLLLLVLPLLGLMPARRDLGEYFVPIRRHTATLAELGEPPWLNRWNGCGEPWFANPQTGVLYPPAWLWRALPPRWALTLEVALHLAWLALGAGILVGRLGGGAAQRRVAEVTAWSVGPVLSLLDVLNNLETLAWLPWVALAATLRGRWRVAAMAAAVAGAWLGAEPQLWALGVALVVAWRWREPEVWAGAALGAALVAVEIVPFAAWVLGGDRGAGAPAGAMLAGAVPPSGWLGLLVPGVAGGSYLGSLFVGAPLLAAAALGVARRRALGVGAAAFALLASLPELGGGDLYLAITGRLVRYPARFAVPAVALLLAAALAGWRRWIEGGGRAATAAAGAASTAAALIVGPPAGRAAAAVLGGLLLAAAWRPRARALRWAAWGVAALAAAVAGAGSLAPAPESEVVAGPAWPEAVAAGRLYAPPPLGPAAARLAASRELRRAWPVGYANLPGIETVRTDAPVADRDLAAHLARADAGPRGRWWVDALGARWVVLAVPPRAPGLLPRANRHGLWLAENRSAMPVVGLYARRPQPGERPRPVPGLVTVVRGDGRVRVRTASGRAGVLWMAAPPDPGWRWAVDGRPVVAGNGPGALQWVVVPPGWREAEMVYRPRGLPAGAAASGAAAALTLALGVWGWRRR